MFRTMPCLVVGCCLAAGSVAGAQPGPPAQRRVEWWVGLAAATPAVDAEITTTYVPIIERYSAPLPETRAGQTVVLGNSRAMGFEAGVNYFFRPHAGIQVLFDVDRHDVTGRAGRYDVRLHYTAMQPPGMVPAPYTFERTYAPCDAQRLEGCVDATSGSLRQITLAVNGVGRWTIGPRVNGEISGGLTLVDVRGDAQPLRYTLFEMGGHSTLFSQEYQLAYRVGPTHGLGFDIGGGIDVGLVPGVSLVADVRYFTGPELSAPVTVTDVLNDDTLVFLQAPATIQQTLQPPDVQIAPTRVRLVVGLKIGV